MIVLDTSVVLALLNARDRNHGRARDWAMSNQQGLVTTPLAVAEMDHLVRRFAGGTGADALWSELESGAYGVRWWPAAMVDSLKISRRWREIDLGLVDASLVALAGHIGAAEIATFDQRHFRAVTPEPVGTPGKAPSAFRLLPFDIA